VRCQDILDAHEKAVRESLRPKDEQLVIVREQCEYHAREAATLKEEVKKLQNKISSHKEVGMCPRVLRHTSYMRFKSRPRD
jgi:hypothetical protein